MAAELQLARLLAESATQENDDSYTLTKTGLPPLSIPAGYLDYDSGDATNKPIMSAGQAANDGRVGKYLRRVWGWFWGHF